MGFLFCKEITETLLALPSRVSARPQDNANGPPALLLSLQHTLFSCELALQPLCSDHDCEHVHSFSPNTRHTHKPLRASYERHTIRTTCRSLSPRRAAAARCCSSHLIKFLILCCFALAHQAHVERESKREVTLAHRPTHKHTTSKDPCCAPSSFFVETPAALACSHA